MKWLAVADVPVNIGFSPKASLAEDKIHDVRDNRHFLPLFLICYYAQVGLDAIKLVMSGLLELQLSCNGESLPPRLEVLTHRSNLFQPITRTRKGLSLTFITCSATEDRFAFLMSDKYFSYPARSR